MKLEELAALATVRNHISALVANRNATTKGSSKQLNSLGIFLDKVFVEECLELDVGRAKKPIIDVQNETKPTASPLSQEPARKIAKPAKKAVPISDPEVAGILADRLAQEKAQMDSKLEDRSKESFEKLSGESKEEVEDKLDAAKEAASEDSGWASTDKAESSSTDVQS